MTAYQGGKKQIGKYIFETIINAEKVLNYDDKPMPYLEPFCGMGGVLVHFSKENRGRKIQACDINRDIICMWRALQKGWQPPTNCTKERYESLKYTKRHSAERGFIGVVCSFGGQFFRGNFRTKSSVHNFVEAGSRGVLKAAGLMPSPKVKFLTSKSYDSFEPKNMLIYCDPPYAGNTVSNDTFQNFDHESFWVKMREWSENNYVFISERYAPDDFVSIWKKDYKVSFLTQGEQKNNKKQYEEHLFIHISLFEKLFN